MKNLTEVQQNIEKIEHFLIYNLPNYKGLITLDHCEEFAQKIALIVDNYSALEIVVGCLITASCTMKYINNVIADGKIQ